jgi:hypothetical protein
LEVLLLVIKAQGLVNVGSLGPIKAGQKA